MIDVFWLIIALSSLLTVFWLLSVPVTIKTPPERSGRVSYVIDGDTFILSGNRQKIRLWGVDAPESDQSGGQAATDHLIRVAHGQKVSCREITTDRYGRSVARCFLSDGREVNRMMIESPYAKEYRRFTKGYYRH